MEAGEHTEKINLQELLKETVSEEHFFSDAHKRTFVFFATFNSTVLAAVVAGVMQANDSNEFFFLIFGSAVIFMVSTLGKEGTFRYYQRMLEAITVRAKIEDALGISSEPTEASKRRSIWPDEPIVATRHLESRERYDSS